jgi:hypothetical protein
MAARSSNSMSNTVGQFEHWSKEKTDFLQRAARADQERTRLQEHTKQLRKLQQELIGRIQAAADQDGLVSRNLQMLAKEKDNLIRQLQAERAELEQTADDLDKLQLSGRKEKRAFFEEMKGVNEEWGDVLKKQDDLRLSQMISMETVPLFFEGARRLDAAAPAIQMELEAAVQELQEHTDEYYMAGDRHNYLQGVLEQFREQAKSAPWSKDASGASQVRRKTVSLFRISLLADSSSLFLVLLSQFLTDDALTNLEMTWMNHVTTTTTDGDDDYDQPETLGPDDSLQMDLFYGNESQGSSVAVE